MAMSADIDTLRAVRRALARRSGPVLPLVSEPISPNAYVHERAVCIDTTAAGGNATLLAAAESAHNSAFHHGQMQVSLTLNTRARKHCFSMIRYECGASRSAMNVVAAQSLFARGKSAVRLEELKKLGGTRRSPDPEGEDTIVGRPGFWTGQQCRRQRSRSAA